MHKNILINLLLSFALAAQYSFCEEVYKDLSSQIPEEENLAVCSILIEESKKNNLEIAVTLAVAWEESRLTEQPRPNPYKCVGPLQIKYQYWCPNKKGNISAIKRDGILKKCDLFYHGVKALKYYKDKFKPLNKALCFYNNSLKCSEKNKYYSSYVINVNNHMKKIKRILKKYKSL